MRTRLVCILVLAGLVTQAAAQSTFTRRDVAVGDPKVSYGSTEFSPDWKYLIWGEYATDGADNMVMWHCEMKTKLFTVLGLLVGASAWAADPAPEEKIGLNVGEKAPAFTLKDQAGKERTLDEFTKAGKVAIVFHRSASW